MPGFDHILMGRNAMLICGGESHIIANKACGVPLYHLTSIVALQINSSLPDPLSS
jgi:hypothetical protein